MPNEKLPEINEHDAEELIHYPQDEEQKERRSRLLPGRWTRRVQKSSARAQARRRVAEKTSEDHAYLMLGAVPFWAVNTPRMSGLPARARDFLSSFRLRLGTRSTMYLNASALKLLESNLLFAIVKSSFHIKVLCQDFRRGTHRARRKSYSPAFYRRKAPGLRSRRA